MDLAIIGALLGDDLLHPLWCDMQRWRYALPDESADFGALNGTTSRLFFAGDYAAGQGRVHLAITSGWRVAALINGALGPRRNSWNVISVHGKVVRENRYATHVHLTSYK